MPGGVSGERQVPGLATSLMRQPDCCLGGASLTEFLVSEHGIAIADEFRTGKCKFSTDHSSALQWNFPTQKCDSEENQGLKWS